MCANTTWRNWVKLKSGLVHLTTTTVAVALNCDKFTNMNANGYGELRVVFIIFLFRIRLLLYTFELTEFYPKSNSDSILKRKKETFRNGFLKFTLFPFDACFCWTWARCTHRIPRKLHHLLVLVFSFDTFEHKMFKFCRTSLSGFYLNSNFLKRKNL